MILDSHRSSESFLCPISWAVLIPTPPSTPTDSATPSLPAQLKAPSKPSQLRFAAVNRYAPSTTLRYWNGM
ncbi:Uncharacterised protein [Mycobacterium tuberculosis]|uniref:Uncharacterized protein n=1 Tax=Mycobacterium tuberculosis TaxID=1773 RepID=A0A655A4G4_MYCTX|nr:Uncharacterised protein [Mycobacterium tuberculosis]CKP16423.1 Uncharacterised protein [Mycobacterium tuberculosis]CKR58326.1 Uncharacterised protein [Mycobacterium tuberculosis]CKR92589.1 Uncharacterised protein [Mycobacterium tuberculosis]CKS20864.1 Uncharacterised protein [Mycobacterium tuberculosis]